MDARVGGETQTSHPRFFNLELFSALGAGFFQMQCAERRPQIEFLAAACRESGAGLRTRRALLPMLWIRRKPRAAPRSRLESHLCKPRVVPPRHSLALPDAPAAALLLPRGRQEIPCT